MSSAARLSENFHLEECARSSVRLSEKQIARYVCQADTDTITIRRYYKREKQRACTTKKTYVYIVELNEMNEMNEMKGMNE